MRGGVRFVRHDVGELTTRTVRDLVDCRRLGDLLTAEPPVVFKGVVLPVLEAPIRWGFALGHILIVTLPRSAVANKATVDAVQRMEVLMLQKVSQLLVTPAVASAVRFGPDCIAAAQASMTYSIVSVG